MRTHRYSTDNDYRVQIIAGLGILAYLIGTWLANFLVWLTTLPSALTGVQGPVTDVLTFLWSPLAQLGLRPEAWVPTTGLLFAILFALFNRRWWRHPVVQSSPFVTTPDLKGEWKVRIHQTNSAMASDGGGDDGIPSERVGMNTSVIGTATIEQTWRRILISMNFEDSISTSLGASIITDTNPLRLHYYYRNEPKPSAPDNTVVHYGTTDLRYDEEKGVLEGEYFTDRFRQTSGEIVLERKSNTNTQTGEFEGE